MTRTLEQEIDRFYHLLSGVAAHIDRVAEEYVKSLGLRGKPLEDGLVRKGIERGWLQALEEIGKGLAIPEVLFLATDKRELLLSVDLKTQRQVIDKGIGGKPLDEVSIDIARESVLKIAPKTRREYPSRGCRKKMPKSRKPSTTEIGILVVDPRLYPWHEIADLFIVAVGEKQVPKRVITRIRKVCEQS